MSRPQTIYIPVGEFHRGNTSTYAERAFQQLGHTAKIVDAPEFYTKLRSEPEALFFCVDSGKPIDLEVPEIKDLSLSRVAYWLIDFRHHKDGPRDPTDSKICRSLQARGGWIFQSQREDWEYSKAQGWSRSSFLPLAADPEIWSDTPAEEKRFHLAFAGNVWDQGRAEVLQTVLQIPGLRFGFPGHGKLWLGEAAKLLRSAKIGFNVNSWYGAEHAFDINMRFFETLSCGVPLITNWVPSLDEMFPKGASFVAAYKSASELPALIGAKLADENFISSGPEARKWILENATYVQRMKEALTKFE